jgi:hypothetical protein
MSLQLGVDIVIASIFNDYITMLPLATPSKVGTSKSTVYNPKPVAKAALEGNTSKKVGVSVVVYNGSLAYDIGGQHLVI